MLAIWWLVAGSVDKFIRNKLQFSQRPVTGSAQDQANGSCPLGQTHFLACTCAAQKAAQKNLKAAVEMVVVVVVVVRVAVDIPVEVVEQPRALLINP